MKFPEFAALVKAASVPARRLKYTRMGDDIFCIELNDKPLIVARVDRKKPRSQHRWEVINVRRSTDFLKPIATYRLDDLDLLIADLKEGKLDNEQKQRNPRPPSSR